MYPGLSQQREMVSDLTEKYFRCPHFFGDRDTVLKLVNAAVQTLLYIRFDPYTLHHPASDPSRVPKIHNAVRKTTYGLNYWQVNDGELQHTVAEALKSLKRVIDVKDDMDAERSIFTEERRGSLLQVLLTDREPSACFFRTESSGPERKLVTLNVIILAHRMTSITEEYSKSVLRRLPENLQMRVSDSFCLSKGLFNVGSIPFEKWSFPVHITAYEPVETLENSAFEKKALREKAARCHSGHLNDLYSTGLDFLGGVESDANSESSAKEDECTVSSSSFESEAGFGQWDTWRMFRCESNVANLSGARVKSPRSSVFELEESESVMSLCSQQSSQKDVFQVGDFLRREECLEDSHNARGLLEVRGQPAAFEAKVWDAPQMQCDVEKSVLQDRGRISRKEACCLGGRVRKKASRHICDHQRTLRRDASTPLVFPSVKGLSQSSFSPLFFSRTEANGAGGGHLVVRDSSGLKHADVAEKRQLKHAIDFILGTAGKELGHFPVGGINDWQFSFTFEVVANGAIVSANESILHYKSSNAFVTKISCESFKDSSRSGVSQTLNTIKNVWKWVPEVLQDPLLRNIPHMI